MIVGIIVGIVAVAVIAGFVFVNQPSFGRAPQGERLERIKKSPHYKDGEFRNLHSTVMMTSQKGRLGAFWGFLFKKETDLRSETEIPVIKTDLSKISKDENVLVWFGHCLPARHFSGRSLKANQALWASFLIETPLQKIYMGGDSGYDTHFAEIGKQYPGIDLAILENGQYNEDWKYIHTMPQYLGQAARDLNAEKILTVHHL